MKRLIAVDLDGTVFDDRHRLNMINKTLKGDEIWAAYHAASNLDNHYPNVLAPVLELAKESGEIQFWTARNEKYRDDTIHKLQYTLGTYLDFTIKMRPNGNLIPSPELKFEWLYSTLEAANYDEIHLFEDREDVCDAYFDCFRTHFKKGTKAKIFVYKCKDGEIISKIDADFVVVRNPEQKEIPKTFCSATAADILDGMAATFRERNSVYGDNAVMVGKVMEVLFPNGVTLKTPEDYHMWHLFELKIVKLTRFAISGLRHQDSIHDDGVYSAMCERLVDAHNINFNKG